VQQAFLGIGVHLATRAERFKLPQYLYSAMQPNLVLGRRSKSTDSNFLAEPFNEQLCRDYLRVLGDQIYEPMFCLNGCSI